MTILSEDQIDILINQIKIVVIINVHYQLFCRLSWFYLYCTHIKLNLFGFITEYDKMWRFIRTAFTLDISKFMRIEVKL